MAVPPLTYWNVGENPTQTILNTRIRDAINFLKNPPHCVLRKSGTQAIPTSNGQAIAWDVEEKDSDAGHSTVTNTGRYTAQTAGWYYLTATVMWAGATIGRRDVYFRKNGNFFLRWGQQTVVPGPDASADVGQVIAAHMYLVVGDWLEVIAYQDSGGNLNVKNSNSDPRWELLWVST